ncbi:MAG: FixH family protein [Rhodobacteraceae bacterium]|nr:FixH family protein [Paracoccaceae bacterium]
MTTKPLTGRKVFLITASAFGVIIAVNVTLAVQAVRTFPGVEVKNSYVASQNFDADREAQLALGWQVSATIKDGELLLSIRDTSGVPVVPQSVSGTLGRATTVAYDSTPEFSFDGQNHVARVEVTPGNWNLRLVAVAEDGTEFRQRIPIWVRSDA